MKKSILRVFSAVMAAGICLSGLAGCGKRETAEKDGVTKIEMWCDYASSKKVYSALIDEYNNGQGKKDGVFIDFQVKEGGTLNQNIELAMQTDDAPDIFTGGTIAKLVEDGNIAAIEDLPGGEEFLKYYKDNNLLRERVSVFDGKTYKVPVAATVRGLIYNKDMFKAAGIVDKKGNALPPETFDEMVKDAKKLTDASKKQYGYIMPIKWSGLIGSDVTGIASASIGHSGYDRITDTYRFEDMAPILDAYKEMYTKGYCYPGAESIDNDNARAYFAAGRIGMKMAYSFDVGVLNDQFPAECDWGVAPVPVLDKDNKYYQPIVYSYSVAINKKSAEKYGDKIMKVLNYIYSDDFFRSLYEQGVSIPIKPEVISSAKFDGNVKKGWKEFAELVKISKYAGKEPEVDWSTVDNIQENIVANVFSGKKSSEEVLAQYSKSVEQGRQAYYSLHPEYKSNEYKDTKWDFRR